MITWHDFKTSSPHGLYPSDVTPLDILKDHRKTMDDARLVSNQVSNMQKANSIGDGILRLVKLAGNTPGKNMAKFVSSPEGSNGSSQRVFH